MQKPHSWMTQVAIVLAVGCGEQSGSESEGVASRRSAIAPVPYVSPDFPVDEEPVPQSDTSVKVLSVSASNSAGYLFVHEVPYAPGDYSRIAVGILYGGNPYTASDIVFTHLGATSSTPLTLAKLPSPPLGSVLRNALVADIGSAWLVVYDVMTAAKVSRYSVILERDGSWGDPIALPDPCGYELPFTQATGDDMRKLIRGADTVLLTDGCGDGLLFDLAGHLLKRLLIANPSELPNWTGRGFIGGQVAFDGSDYLVIYAYPDDRPKYVWGFPISPAGEAGAAFSITTSIVSYKTVYPLSLAANDHSFLLTFAQGRTQGPETATTYREVVEASDHSFSVGAERFVLGETVVGPGTRSDADVNAFSLNGQLVIALQSANGHQLLYPSADPEVADKTQLLPPVPSHLVTTTDAQVLMYSDFDGVRLDGTLQVLDNPALLLRTSTLGQFTPSFAFDGQGYAVAWAETLGKVPSDVSGHRLSGTGGLVDPGSFDLARGCVSPLLTANPTHVMATWNGLGSAFAGAAEITTTDPPIVTPIVSPAFEADEFGVASDGEHSAVTWMGFDCVSGCERLLHMVKLETSGTWSPALTIAGITRGTACPPAVAFIAGQYAVLWVDDDSAGERGIYGASVSQGMQLLSPTPKEILHFSPERSLLDDCGLEMISAGDHLLFSWREITNATEAGMTDATEEIRLARLSPALEVLDPGGILASAQQYPLVGVTSHRIALGWDGTTVWTIWRDGEGGMRRPLARLHGRRFSDALVPVDPDSFLISDDLDEFSRVTLAMGADGAGMVGYTRYLASERSFRVRARFLSSSRFSKGMPCSTAEQCQQGACVAGSCSNSIGAAGASGVAGESGVIVGIGGGEGLGGSGGGGVSAGGAAAGVSGVGGVMSVGGSTAGGGALGAVSENAGSSGIANNDGEGGSLGNAAGSANTNEAGSGQSGAGSGGTAAGSDSCSCQLAGGGHMRTPLSALLALSMLGMFMNRRRTSAKLRVQTRRRCDPSCRPSPISPSESGFSEGRGEACCVHASPQ